MSIKQFSDLIHYRSQLFELVIQSCQELLATSSEAEEVRNYINNRVSSQGQIQFEIGYFPPDNYLELLTKKVKIDILKELGLVYDSFPYCVNRGILNQHNLIIPYRDDYGNIVALIGRCILAEAELKKINPEAFLSKYKYTSNFSKSLHLFGLDKAKNEIRRTGSVIIVEGQIDCISCHVAGIQNVVALGGADFSRHQFYLINKFADNIYLLLDNDIAGFKGEKKIKHIYQKYSSIKKIFLPEEYKDIDQYLKEQGPDKLFQLKE